MIMKLRVTYQFVMYEIRELLTEVAYATQSPFLWKVQRLVRDHF